MRMLRRFVVLLAAAALGPAAVSAQDRLKTMAGYERAQKMTREAGTAVRGGNLAVTWIDANTFEYTRDSKRYRFDVAARKASETTDKPGGSGRAGGSGRSGGSGGIEPDRGRQFESALSPDGVLKAI